MSEHDLHVLVARFAWTLIHFLWQGVAIALGLQLLLTGLRRRTASTRYLVRCAALGGLALAPIVTFVVLGGESQEDAEHSLLALASAVEAPTGTWETWLASGDLLPWVVVLWSIGATFCSVRLAGGCWQVRRLRRRVFGVDLTPGWQRRFERLAREFGVRARARVVESVSVAVPAVIGCVKPVVLLPARLFTGLTEEQIEALIAHELAHVARHDYLVNLVQSVLEALLFYHPAVWWISRGIRIEREYCCDDRAVAATHDGLTYAHALTAIECWRGRQPQMGVSTLGGSLMQRIQRLVGVETSPPRAVRPFHAVAALLVAGSLGASAFGLAALPDPTAGDGCPCSCHQKKKPAETVEVVTLPELRVLTKDGDVWVIGAPEGELQERVRRNWTRPVPAPEGVTDERSEYARLKAEVVELRRAIAEMRGEIAELVGGAPPPKRVVERVKGEHRGRVHVNVPKWIESEDIVLDEWHEGQEGEGPFVVVEPEFDEESGILTVKPHVQHWFRASDARKTPGVLRFESNGPDHSGFGRRQVFSFNGKDFVVPDGVLGEVPTLEGVFDAKRAQEYQKQVQELVGQLEGLKELKGLPHVQKLELDIDAKDLEGYERKVQQFFEQGEGRKMIEQLQGLEALKELPQLESIGEYFDQKQLEEYGEKMQQFFEQGEGRKFLVELQGLESLKGLGKLRERKAPDLEHLEGVHVLRADDLSTELQELVKGLKVDGKSIELDVKELSEQVRQLVKELQAEEVEEEDAEAKAPKRRVIYRAR